MANKKQTTNDDSAHGQSTTGAGNAGTTGQFNAGGRGNSSGQSASPQATSSLSDLDQSRSDQPGSGQSRTTMATTTNTSGGSGAAVARSLYDQAKETAGQAYEIAAEKATTKLEEQKTNLSGGLSTIAESVRKVGENLRGPDVQEGISKYTAEYSGKAAEKIEGVADYFERKGVREMYSDLEDFARRNPLAFIGGAFALGLLTARFLKSERPRRMAAKGAAFANESSSDSPSASGSGISTSQRR